MLATAAFDHHVLARLLDFFSDRTAWQRTLWSSGTVLSLNELLEASDQVAAGVVGQAAMAHYAHCIEIAALRDFGVGDESRRRLLGSLLRTDDRNRTLAAYGLQYKTIEQLIPEVTSEYLKRWSDTLTSLAAIRKTGKSRALHCRSPDRLRFSSPISPQMVDIQGEIRAGNEDAGRAIE